VIRYNRTRTEEIHTQSVAEHTFNMQALAQYFLPLEDDSAELDAQRVFKMITWHDIGEIESGDVMGFLKTAEDKANDAPETRK
jgi:5'-deoxynucleotidase YfbR-like HD superfamily hydrolase